MKVRYSGYFQQALATAAMMAIVFVGNVYANLGAELRQLTAPDGGAGAPFGTSVDLSGTTAIISGLGDDTLGQDAGAAYLFDLSTGSVLHKLTANDAAPGDVFGKSVAINGNVAVVGAHLNDDHGNASGSAYIFNALTGQQRFKLTASGATSGDQFGISVDVSGNVAIVGAHNSDAVGYDAGAAYLFDATTGQQLYRLTASDASPEDWFGWSVGISGDVAIVGTRYDDDGGTNSGAAYLFNVATGQQLFKLKASDAAAGDDFGWSVAISGNRAIVGAHLDNDLGAYSGSAYVFDVTTGQQLYKLKAGDGQTEDEFGRSVAISGNTAIVGASHDDVSVNASGSAYGFDLATGQQLFKFTAGNATPASFLGGSVAIDEGIALAGAPSHLSRGTVYVFSAVPEPNGFLLLAGLFAAQAHAARRGCLRRSDLSGVVSAME